MIVEALPIALPNREYLLLENVSWDFYEQLLEDMDQLRVLYEFRDWIRSLPSKKRPRRPATTERGNNDAKKEDHGFDSVISVFSVR